jgi:hypothetical protein
VRRLTDEYTRENVTLLKINRNAQAVTRVEVFFAENILSLKAIFPLGKQKFHFRLCVYYLS